MPVYNYLARDKNGQAVRGKINMSSEAELLNYLEKQNLLAISFDKAKSKASILKAKDIVIFKPRIKKKDVIVFTRQFATTVKAGIPVVNALRFLVEETQDKYFKSILRKHYQEIRR